MNTVIGKDDIDGIAARWVARMDRGTLSEIEQRDLDAWLDADMRHRGAFVRAQAIWCDMNRVAALGAGEIVSARHSRWYGAMLPRVASIAACVLALVASVGVSSHYLVGRESTDRGETRRLVLDDGSALALNTQSVLQVKYDDDERRIVLRHGEATFQVAHDQQRPFVVQAGDISVRAVGTAFNIRMKPEGVEVTVTEGVVDILRTDDPSKAAIRRVRHNEEVIAHAWQPAAPETLNVEPLSDEVIGRRLAWQQGRLIFEGDRLAAAIEEVNRYSSNTVVIHDPELAQKAFVGTFQTGDARGFAHAVAAAFNMRVVEQDEILHLTQ
ncbi:FecR family protein [Peristeroidobacter agariperforans]|uniref:FecR family protein n=1 Tax=Peristeroidobacter agariperforans TaxID=268404 RepID=UPI00101B7468|nr:FecR domain-containing protein [Peristeroidobacter agariperforans]